MSKKVDEIMEALFGEAQTTIALAKKLQEEHVPLPEMDKTECVYHSLSDQEQSFALSLVKTDEFMDALSNLLDAIQESAFAAEAIISVQKAPIDFVKTINAAMSDVSGINGRHYTITITKR